MLKVPLPDRVEIWRKYWLLRVPIDPIRFKGTEGGVPSWSWPTVKKVAREFLELGEPDVRALEDPLLLEKWRELMTALDLGESEVRALKYPLLLERWRELKSGEDIGEDNVDQGGEEPLYEQYEDSPVARFFPLVRVVAKRGMKGGVYGGS